MMSSRSLRAHTRWSRLRFWREHGGEWPGDGEEVGEGEFHAGLVSSYQFTFLLRLGG